MASTTLLHIIHSDDWNALAGQAFYRPESLATEGFIHCSYPGQVLTPANERFAGQHGLLLLDLDPTKLDAPLIVEDSYGSGTAFPHIYGPLPLAAVNATIAFPCSPDGSFALPPGLVG